MTDKIQEQSHCEECEGLECSISQSPTLAGLQSKVHKLRYAASDQETWGQTAYRAANAIAMAEQTPELKAKYTGLYANTINALDFIPGGRILRNAGKVKGSLLNCFVLGVEDTIESIANDLYAKALIISKYGGGIGFNASSLRPEGEELKSQGSNSRSSGTVSFIDGLDHILNLIKGGGDRRAAGLAMLEIWHPETFNFIKAKYEDGRLPNFNLSVGVTESFIKAVKGDKEWELKYGNKVYKTVLARELWDYIVKHTWEVSEPGIINIDKMQRDNNLWYSDTIASTNPCVSGDTLILTDGGYFPIEDLVGINVKIWDGMEWTLVKPEITGHNQNMFTIKFSNGEEITCTRYHKFILKDGSELAAENLCIGDKLSKFDMPLINFDDSYNGYGDPYTQGFFCGDGWFHTEKSWNCICLYGTKMELLEKLDYIHHREEQNGNRIFLRISNHYLPRDFVPSFKCTINDKLLYFSGICDSDGTVTNDGSIQISSVNFEYLKALKRMLNTLGVDCHIVTMHEEGIREMPNGKGGKSEYLCQKCYRLLLPAWQVKKLINVGFKTHRLKLRDTIIDRDCKRFIKVVEIIDDGRIDKKVYCFKNHINGTGVFNGIKTAQCGELPLPVNSACCLGSINLSNMYDVKRNEVNWKKLRETIALSIRFLDSVLDVTYYPITEIGLNVQAARRIGLGTMGLHHLMLKLGIKEYGSDEALEFIDDFYRRFRDVSYTVSTLLAEEKGSFDKFISDKYLQGNFVSTLPRRIRKNIKALGIRNGTILSIAPTGTIGLLAGTSQGLEPIFSPIYKRKYYEGGTIREVEEWDPLFKDFVLQGKDVSHFIGAYEVSPSQHLEVQNTVQQYIDNSISKTINIANDYPKEKLSVLLLDHIEEIKGTTVYRGGSKGKEILTPCEYKMPKEQLLALLKK